MAKKKFNANQKTVEACRSLGWMAETAEKYNHITRRRQDLFGFLDIVCIGGVPSGTLYIQATAGGHGRDRIQKILEAPRKNTEWEGTLAEDAKFILQAGNAIQVWSWRLYKDGGRKFRDAVRWELVIGLDPPQGIIVRELCSFNELYNSMLDTTEAEV